MAKNISKNFKFKNYLFGATNINSDKEKHVYSGYGITFGTAGSWSFDKNVINFGVDNSLLVHHLIWQSQEKY